ncbi:hypothetical protein Tco_0996122 [Tanacetum coccineum]
MPEQLPSKLSSTALAVLTTRPACHPSLVSCLSSLKESLPSVPYVYDQSLEALPYQSAAYGTASDVPGSGTRVHTPAHGGSEAHNGLHDSILPNEAKPFEKHRPPPPQSVLSLDELLIVINYIHV